MTSKAVYVYWQRGQWWVRCKHGDRVGPFATNALARAAATDIAKEPSA